MATQYTGGTTTGQVLTAAIMNQIGAAWETWTPTVTASAGTFTTVTVHLAKFGRIQSLVYGQIDFTITSIGTASGVPLFTLPITSTSVNFMAAGQYRETVNTGSIGVVSIDSTTAASLRRSDNAAHIAAANRYGCSFMYQAA